MRLLIITLLLIFSIQAHSCSCATIPLRDNLLSAQFVATAKILDITEDASDKNYHNIEIGIIDLYKGKAVKILKIYSALMSSCAFYAEKNSTWLIFASTFNGVLSFGYCSGSVQVDRKFNEIEYPGLTSKYKSTIDLKLSVLSWLKKKKIDLLNKHQIQVNRSTKRIEELKGYHGKTKDFAIIEYALEKDLKLKKAKLVKKFKNNILNKDLIKSSADEFKAYHKTLKEIPEPTKLYVIYYFYPQEGTDRSFLSRWDL